MPGQVALGLMVNPPQPGDESYPLFRKEKDGAIESLKRRAKLITAAFNEMEGVSCQVRIYIYIYMCVCVCACACVYVCLSPSPLLTLTLTLTTSTTLTITANSLPTAQCIPSPASRSQPTSWSWPVHRTKHQMCCTACSY